MRESPISIAKRDKGSIKILGPERLIKISMQDGT